MAKRNSCAQGVRYSQVPEFNNGQYCVFEQRQEVSADNQVTHCLKFTGYSYDRELQTYDTCADFEESLVETLAK